MATNRFLCEICGKGFQRDQNLQLHRRGHNLPWKLKQRSSKEVRKRVYVCPEKSCVHHHPSRALGDLTGIKKHFCRKHGEKKWKCEKCSKRYAVQSDWKAHSKTCGTREYKCGCGTIFSRRDSFITHRAFCDALAEETARVTAASNVVAANSINYQFVGASLGAMGQQPHFSSIFKPITTSNSTTTETCINPIRQSAALPLWMGHGISSSHQGHQDKIPNTSNNNNLQQIPHQHHLINSAVSTVISSSSSSGLLFPTDSFVNSTPTNYQLDWDFGSKLSSSSNSGPTSTLALNKQLKENDGGSSQNSNQMMMTVPSLFSTQHLHQSHQTHSSAAATISATALLQKAAQIGATTSTTDQSLFLGSFGFKSNDDSSIHDQEGLKFSELHGTTTTTTSTNLQSSGIHHDHLLSMNQLQMYPSKRRHIQSEDTTTAAAGGGHTRDFLGVGVQPICHPSSINGWI
ncbi:OLC1v1023865C1 [Oldenlandia corymbosa var. corymbosa]|nr:OLC1v1023865C1 [Oldenlandia corymbosa var. corymbosa]